MLPLAASMSPLLEARASHAAPCGAYSGCDVAGAHADGGDPAVPDDDAAPLDPPPNCSARCAAEEEVGMGAAATEPRAAEFLPPSPACSPVAPGLLSSAGAAPCAQLALLPLISAVSSEIRMEGRGPASKPGAPDLACKPWELHEATGPSSIM
jgi:hypothetical protein